MANPNPSPSTRFKKGQSGNPSGRSTDELKAHHEAAKIAAKLKLDALSCLQELVAKETNSENIIALLMNGDALRMFKEVEDRAHGTPKQSVDNTSSDGSMRLPTEIVIRGVEPDGD